MKRKVYIIIQSIISFIAVAYQGINIVDGEYIWLDKFTEAFNGFGVSGMLIPLMILFFYYFLIFLFFIHKLLCYVFLPIKKYITKYIENPPYLMYYII